MKPVTKSLFLALVFMLIFATVSPAMAATKTASLLEVRFILSKGLVFLIDLKGDWRPADLKGATVTVNKNVYPLDCSFRDDGDAACTGARGLMGYAGQDMLISFGGFAFTYGAPADVMACAADEWMGLMVDVYGPSGYMFTSYWWFRSDEGDYPGMVNYLQKYYRDAYGPVLLDVTWDGCFDLPVR